MQSGSISKYLLLEWIIETNIVYAKTYIMLKHINKLKFNSINTSWSVNKYFQTNLQDRPTVKRIYKINNSYGLWQRSQVTSELSQHLGGQVSNGKLIIVPFLV